MFKMVSTMEGLAESKKRIIILLIILLGTVAVSLYINLIMGQDIIYTHIFYLPIILAGLWYYRKALYIALFLGLIHISINVFAEGTEIFSAIMRAVAFCIIALVVGLLSEKKDQYWLGLKQTEESLYLSEERFRRLAENAPDIIFDLQLSPEMSYNYVSPAVTAITGYIPEDFYDDPSFILKITHPEDVTKYNKMIMGDMKTAEPVVTRWFHKDSKVLWLEIKAAYIFDSSRKVVALEGMVRDITTRVRLEEDLREKYKEIRNMSGRLLSAHEEERTRLARELHDEIGQALTVISMDLEYLQIKASQVAPPLLTKLSESTSLLEETLGNVRQQITALRPPALDNMGLLEVIHDMAQDLESRTGLTIDIHKRGFTGRLPTEIETALYRCVQEALTNTLRYADATMVKINFEYKEENLFLLIEDNGKGFDTEEVGHRNKGIGLAGIRERVHLLEGSVHVSSGPGLGTKISIVIPLVSKYEPSGEKNNEPGSNSLD